MKTTIIVVAGAIAVIIGGLWSAGFFQKVDFTVQEIGPMKAVYLEHKGAYSKIVSKIDETAKYLEENKISRLESFGEYFDDPQKVKTEDLRSNAGFIVEKLPKVKPPLMMKTFAKKSYVTASFTGHPMIGVMVVYPKAMKWLGANSYDISGPVIELYNLNGKKITTTYLFEVKKGAPSK